MLYPGVRRCGRPGADPTTFRNRLDARAVRAGLKAVVRRYPEVMVKVTGGGRGMGAVKAHMLYICRGGGLDMETDDGDVIRGREEVTDLVWEWQHSGAYVPAESHRREAFHLMLSMPPDTNSQAVLWAAREFAAGEFVRFKYAMVLHEPEADPKSHRPHVHLIVRAQGADGQRLNPRKADLARWRQLFADRLMERGVAACATKRQTRGILQPPKTLLDHHVGGLERKAWPIRPGQQALETERSVIEGWREVVSALARSARPEDRALAQEAAEFVKGMPSVRRKFSQRDRAALSRERPVAARQPRAARQHDRSRGPER